VHLFALLSEIGVGYAGMSEIAHEIASQPSAWAEAAERARGAADALPPHGARVAVVGCGTSLYMSQAYAALREAAGHGEADAFPASEIPSGRTYDAILAISRSGTTTEVLRLLEALPPGAPTIVISAVADSPIVRAAGRAIVLDFADERSVVQTRFATSVLALLRAHLGEDLAPVIADGGRALEADLPVRAGAFDHLVFLGRGWTVGLANEAALKVKETSGSFSESYPAMEYRHGPISLAGERSLVWALGDVAADLLEDVRGTGAAIVAGELDPMAELVKIQRTAVVLAEAKGLDPDHPRHLTRSVVLS
jgi:fructoselysine-6-P-deglycase FrlB-like protein